MKILNLFKFRREVHLSLTFGVASFTRAPYWMSCAPWSLKTCLIVHKAVLNQIIARFNDIISIIVNHANRKSLTLTQRFEELLTGYVLVLSDEKHTQMFMCLHKVSTTHQIAQHMVDLYRVSNKTQKYRRVRQIGCSCPWRALSQQKGRPPFAEFLFAEIWNKYKSVFSYTSSGFTPSPRTPCLRRPRPPSFLFFFTTDIPSTSC